MLVQWPLWLSDVDQDFGRAAHRKDRDRARKLVQVMQRRLKQTSGVQILSVFPPCCQELQHSNLEGPRWSLDGPKSGDPRPCGGQCQGHLHEHDVIVERMRGPPLVLPQVGTLLHPLPIPHPQPRIHLQQNTSGGGWCCHAKESDPLGPRQTERPFPLGRLKQNSNTPVCSRLNVL